MRARNNPTDAQLMRRMRRKPESIKDPRNKRDAYWALRSQGFPHVVAIRAFRDEAPRFNKDTADTANEYAEGLDPDDILFPNNTELVTMEVTSRPSLDAEVAENASPRNREYTIWDESLKGFGLRVKPSGFRTYICVYRIAGSNQQGRVTIGEPSITPYERAKEIARETRILAKEGINPKTKTKR